MPPRVGGDQLDVTSVVEQRARVVLGGLATALSMIAHFHAIQLAPVSYMISVKRTSLIFSVIYGAIVFKEEHIKGRLLGTSVMLSGALILYLAT